LVRLLNSRSQDRGVIVHEMAAGAYAYDTIQAKHSGRPSELPNCMIEHFVVTDTNYTTRVK
jgi:hypothetical protein